MAGCLRATGEQAAADHAIGERESLDDVARLGDASVGKEAYAFGLGRLTGCADGLPAGWLTKLAGRLAASLFGLTA